MKQEILEKVYNAGTNEERETAYDSWAASYENDLFAMGYRLPAVLSAVFARFVPPKTTPILDAGCGGGLQVEPLAVLGYGQITGVDLSEGMMSVARSKRIYAELKQAVLGETLPFADDHFAATLSCGTITPNHAPPETYHELIRVTRPGGLIVSSLRADAEQMPEYPAMLVTLSDAGKWRHVFSTPSFQTFPVGEPDLLNQVHVHEVL